MYNVYKYSQWPAFHYKPFIGTHSSDIKLHDQQKHYICDYLSKEFTSISRCTSLNIQSE